MLPSGALGTRLSSLVQVQFLFEEGERCIGTGSVCTQVHPAMHSQCVKSRQAMNCTHTRAIVMMGKGPSQRIQTFDCG